MAIDVNAVGPGLLSRHRTEPECRFVIPGTDLAFRIASSTKPIEVEMFFGQIDDEWRIEMLPLAAHGPLEGSPRHGTVGFKITIPYVEPCPVTGPDGCNRRRALPRIAHAAYING